LPTGLIPATSISGSGEETNKMVKFLCDLCGKDISAKVHDSVKQFCGRDYSWQDIVPIVQEDRGRELPDVQHEVEHETNPVYLEIQILNELSKLIHASAWGMRTTAMQCSNCATEHVEGKRGKVITIFTRITEKRCAC
jgi:transposase-like protein